MTQPNKNIKKKEKKIPVASLPLVYPNAAGIDVGSRKHLVCVPTDRDECPVRTFDAFTPDLYQLADWLKDCRITTVALESTGVYWIALHDVLVERGFQVTVVNPRYAKQVPGRSKTDVHDCQWLQKLHSFGLLSGSFRPELKICAFRAYMRLRDNLVVGSSQAVQHMQKACFELNLQLSNVITDITGESGMKIIQAILAGERDPKALAALCNNRIKASRATVAKALHGNWKQEHLDCLKMALQTYAFHVRQLEECDQLIQAQLQSLESKLPDQPRSISPTKQESDRERLDNELNRICGVDLTKIPGIKSQVAAIVLSEVGIDMSRWETEKQFCSHLGLCPNKKITGGKTLSSATRKVYNRAADALRVAAQCLSRSQSALGAKYRRLRGRIGAPKANTAMAHHLARLVYRMLRFGKDYIEFGIHQYEERFRKQRMKWIEKEAKSLNMQLIELN